MAMANDADLLTLYIAIRSQLFIRHHAIGKFWRSDLARTMNHLGQIGHPGIDNIGPMDINENTVVADDASVEDHLKQQPVVQTQKRMHVALAANENPLLETGLMMAILAIEIRLGNVGSLKILQRTLASLDQLFRFRTSMSHFNGYILRYDATRSDHWTTDAQGRPYVNTEFPYDLEGNYLYCTPASYTGQSAKPPTNMLRRFEPSADELSGLIPGYMMAHTLVPDPGVRATIERQVNAIGDYLAEYAYMLVRPCGGFTFRGATGGLPGLAFSFNRMFKRITGSDFSPRNGFDHVLQAAGLWEKVGLDFRLGQIAGALPSALIALFTPTLYPMLPTLLGALTGIPSSVLGGAAALFAHQSDFNVEASEQGEVAIAYLLSSVPPDVAFQAQAQALKVLKTGFIADYFMYHGLGAIGDSDQTVANAVMGVVSARRAFKLDDQPNLVTGGDPGKSSNRAITSAIVGSLGGPPSEQVRWAQMIQDMYAAFALNPSLSFPPMWQSMLPLAPHTDHIMELSMMGIEYLLGLGLAWLFLKQDKQVDPGAKVAGFPNWAPDFSKNPMADPSVPGDVVQRMCGAGGQQLLVLGNLAIHCPDVISFPLGDQSGYSQSAPSPPADAPAAPVFATVTEPFPIDVGPTPFDDWHSATKFITPPPAPTVPGTWVVNGDEQIDPTQTNLRWYTSSSRALTKSETSTDINGSPVSGNAGDLRIDVSVKTVGGFGSRGRYWANWTVGWKIASDQDSS
jgi:hypothetical protein